MLCIYFRQKCEFFNKEVIILMEMYENFLYSYIQFSPSLKTSLENNFCSPNLFLFSRVSESTGKTESVSRENVWVGSLGSFLVRRVLETDCVAVLEEESSGSYDIGIAASKKANVGTKEEDATYRRQKWKGLHRRRWRHIRLGFS